ncbi:RNA-binding cell elongation regulator Jag/EloR [Chloroflexota bacterium]
MESLEISAKTVEEAIQLALEQLGVSRGEVEVNVVREGKSGIMGLGAEDALVRVEPLTSIPKEESGVTEVVESVLERLLTLMDVAGSIVPQTQSLVEGVQETSASIAFDVKSDDSGILIGRRGQTLSCLQYIVRLIVNHQMETMVPIVIDVEGYKQRRYQALQVLARRMAEQAKAKEMPLPLEPMTAAERRIIHLTLADHPDVTTQSIGQGWNRKVVILPKEE